MTAKLHSCNANYTVSSLTFNCRVIRITYPFPTRNSRNLALKVGICQSLHSGLSKYGLVFVGSARGFFWLLFSCAWRRFRQPRSIVQGSVAPSPILQAGFYRRRGLLLCKSPPLCEGRLFPLGSGPMTFLSYRLEPTRSRLSIKGSRR